MMRSLFRRTTLAALAASVFIAASAAAQTYPTQQSYTPSATLAPVTCSSVVAAGCAVFQLNNVDTLTLRLGGTNTGLNVIVEATNTAIGSPATATWSPLTAKPIDPTSSGGGFRLTGSGLWRVDTSGLKQVRVRVVAITTGTVVVYTNGDSGQAQMLPLDAGVMCVVATGGCTSADQVNPGGAGVRVTFSQTAHTGSPGSDVLLQTKDAASGLYQTIAQTALRTTTDGVDMLTLYPGATVVSGVSNATLSVPAVSLPLGSVWRVVMRGNGAGTVTGTLGADVLK